MFKKNKNLIVIISGICAVLLSFIIFIASCNKDSKTAGDKNETSESQTINDKDSSNIFKTQDKVEEKTEKPEKVQEAKLSSQCDIVLAEGTDENGNIFEIVANEIEDYTGTVTKVGVIKNNQWLKQPSELHPFVNDNLLFFESRLYGSPDGISLKKLKGNIDLKDHVKYVGNGCFTIGNKILYNCNNDQNLDLRKLDETERSTFITNYNTIDCNKRNNYMIVKLYNKHYNLKGTLIWGVDLIYLLNTSTMELKRINVKDSIDVWVEAYNDGLFYYNRAFYDIDGNKVIDVSNYDLSSLKSGTMIFDNGQCTFPIKNDQGTRYDITIDKTGNVINSKLSH